MLQGSPAAVYDNIVAVCPARCIGGGSAAEIFKIVGVLSGKNIVFFFGALSVKGSNPVGLDLQTERRRPDGQLPRFFRANQTTGSDTIKR
jgi:hypothetical protein